MKLQQKNILEHLSASSRLDSVPPIANWQLDTVRQSNGAYRFYSGSWLMVIFPAIEKGGDQQAVIIETDTGASWCGVIHSDGRIIDSCFKR